MVILNYSTINSCKLLKSLHDTDLVDSGKSVIFCMNNSDYIYTSYNRNSEGLEFEIENLKKIIS
ncbi:Uncharacterised protein [[Pasteurella] mairii]|uniref:Uncharacterized protein n=1 Tax=[Pasteurella] mairii TaxID=757 RepID=A0A379B820_9PAST|nr:Uncharacterised protein [[Pasteurella] mairii]